MSFWCLRRFVAFLLAPLSLSLSFSLSLSLLSVVRIMQDDPRARKNRVLVYNTEKRRLQFRPLPGLQCIGRLVYNYP